MTTPEKKGRVARDRVARATGKLIGQACGCGTKINVSYAPDPYRSEIYNDDTPVWMCADCRHERAMDA